MESYVDETKLMQLVCPCDVQLIVSIIDSPGALDGRRPTNSCVCEQDETTKTFFQPTT